MEAEAVRSDIALLDRLCLIADNLVETRRLQIGDAAIRTLRDEVQMRRFTPAEENVIGYEATCLIECIAALAFARTDQNKEGEERAVMYLNVLRQFCRLDLNAARRRAAQ
ncbi:hypothetical protein AC629_42290 [Bradyrhizobium sp. NAS80.1]|uniref:hypothetical protein n=1 Tax=Bradyrhizobium sp. NAS80.1 TaxID=1680159 RepID=UPI00095CC50A|nr:hypothetical protein [Bradyrhizobium sp. NAS80.1]OKO68203.1 hypothetical protein AC629_42290 [Bradyrhizobium sp. NAS80.1]